MKIRCIIILKSISLNCIVVITTRFKNIIKEYLYYISCCNWIRLESIPDTTLKLLDNEIIEMPRYFCYIYDNRNIVKQNFMLHLQY